MVLEMAQKGPGKSYREGISIMELADMFPDEASATAWFELVIWPNGRHCPRCGSTETIPAPMTAGLPYYCQSCHKPFSVRIGSALERSKVPFRKWVFAIYLEMTSLKGVSSMKLHRDIKVTQKTAWFMLHRIRKAWDRVDATLSGPVEVDETYMGGIRKNMPKSRRKQLDGRETVGKAVVAGLKGRETKKVRAKVVGDTRASTLLGFVHENTADGAMVYTDEHDGYCGLAPHFGHEAVNHCVAEYVRGQAHVQRMESFWSMLKRTHKGVYHKISAKYVDRYVREFACRHNVRELDTIEQMGAAVGGMDGQRFIYQDLIAGNGLDNGTRS